MLFADSAGPLTATIIAMEAANRAYAVTASPVKVEDTPQGSASSSSTSLGHDFSQESVYKRESLSITDDAEDDWIRAIMESSNSQASPVQAQVKIATCKVASSSETTTDLIAVTSFSSITTKPVVTVASPEKIIMTSDTETATLTATAIATASTLVNTAIMNITDSYIDEDSWLVEETRLLPSVKLAKRKYGTQPLLSLAKRFSH